MTPVAAARRADPPPERSTEWRERSGRLYEELRRPARAMIRRAFRGTFGDEEIEDIYSSAWLGTLKALARRHDQLDDEEIRKYVLTAVAHHASKELRRRSRRPVAPLEAVEAVADDGVPPDERAAKLEESRITRDLLASLPPRRRAVMLLRYGWGLEPQQVCALVKGLSPRAYRKEITRGVDELTAKLRLLERGEWCADREPVLKAYASGLADSEQRRQAQQHLSHCRPCVEFVGRLGGHLHELGASLAMPGAIASIDDGRFSLLDRAGHAAHRLRDSLGHPFGGHGADSAQEAATQAAVLPGGARGAGAAGAGVLAKVAAMGTAGKLAAVCLGAGAAATACVAAGVVPAALPGVGSSETKVVPKHPAVGRTHARVVERPAPIAAPPLGTVSEAPMRRPPTRDVTPIDDGVPEAAPAADPSPDPAPAPVAPSAPAAQQEFGVASAASSSPSASGSGGSSSAGGGGSAVQQEFGP